MAADVDVDVTADMAIDMAVDIDVEMPDDVMRTCLAFTHLQMKLHLI
jgi:hypothetical protein